MTGPGSAPVSEAVSKLPLRLGEDVIDTVLNLLFRCPHKRVTRPITPVSKDGERDRGTYVVCLECGKQFTYDLNEMRIGKPVSASSTVGVLRTDAPKVSKKLRYTALASAVPIVWIVGKAIGRSKKTQEPDESPKK
jgi:hypothetical protein